VTIVGRKISGVTRGSENGGAVPERKEEEEFRFTVFFSISPSRVHLGA